METKAVDTRAARDFLGRVRELRGLIESKTRKMETLRDMAESTTGHMSDMPRSASPDLQRMETAMCKVADLELEIAEDRVAMEQAKEAITAALCDLDDYREQQVLFYRYVECLSWAHVFTESGYGKSTVYRYHDAGLTHMAQTLMSRDTAKA